MQPWVSDTSGQSWGRCLKLSHPTQVLNQCSLSEIFSGKFHCYFSITPVTHFAVFYTLKGWP